MVQPSFPKKILIVDDSMTSIFRQRILLRPTGHDVVAARDGREALEVASRERPDLILMDVEMPELDGFQVCAILRQQDATRETPIIMVTTHNEQEAMEAGYRSGCTDFVIKPVDGEELLTKVQNYLG